MYQKYLRIYQHLHVYSSVPPPFNLLTVLVNLTRLAVRRCIRACKRKQQVTMRAARRQTTMGSHTGKYGARGSEYLQALLSSAPSVHTFCAHVLLTPLVTRICRCTTTTPTATTGRR